MSEFDEKAQPFIILWNQGLDKAIEKLDYRQEIVVYRILRIAGANKIISPKDRQRELEPIVNQAIELGINEELLYAGIASIYKNTHVPHMKSE